MKRFSSLLITVFILIACQSQADATQTIPANTSTPEITFTSTLKPTTQPTTAPQATPTQTLSVEFPDWAKNPETQILLVPVGTQDKGYENMALFNAETGERFDIPFTEKEREYFWMHDGLSFGFLDKKKLQVDLFSIKNKNISTISIPKESIRFLSKDINNSETIQFSGISFAETNFLFLYTWEYLSLNREYFIYREDFDNSYTSVFDISENRVVNISSPDDEYFDLDSEWSPTSNLLAIVEVNMEPGMWRTFDGLPTFRLRIYDVSSQNVVASYKNVGSPRWSPDGKKFLFQEWKHYENFYWHAESPPCIFDTISGNTNCYNEVLINPNTRFSSLDWSPDQSKISYIVSYGGGSYSSFCTITLSDSKTECQLGNEILKGKFILQYSWSPDSNFISFVYDSVSPYADETINQKIGIANIETGEFFQIGDNMNFFAMGLWRPKLTP